MSDSVKVLLILLAVLALAGIYAVLNWPRQARIAPGPPQTGVVVKPPRTPRAEGRPPRPVTPEGEEQPDASPEVTHNIFAPLFASPPPPVARTDFEPPVMPPPESLTPPPPPRPVPEFLGLLRHEGGQRIFLSVEGEVFVVAPGGRFGPGNHYRLLAVTAQQLTVQHDEDEDSVQIPITEQPISILSSSGPSYLAPVPAAPLPPLEPEAPEETEALKEPEAVVPPESGKPDEEVPLDQIIDE